MSKLSDLKRKHLNGRSITVDAFTTDDGAVLIEGTLEDLRHMDMYSWTGETMPPGPIHRMAARFLVDGAAPRILEAEAEVLKSPTDECPEVEDSVKKLAGLAIGPGFSKAVKDRLGATKGCVHLTALTLAMGAVGLQGWMVNQRQNPMAPEMIEFMVQAIKNTCHVWRVDGPRYREVMAEVEQLKKTSS